MSNEQCDVCNLKSALLFEKKLVEDLEAYGFKIIHYNLCVADKIINCKQMTVIWHVDVPHCEYQMLLWLIPRLWLHSRVKL